MKRNPYAKISFAQPVVATELSRGRGTEHFVGSNGDLNASNKVDLLKQITAFMEQASFHGAVSENVAYERASLKQQHEDAITAAFADKDACRELGEVLTTELYQAANREGFMRRFLARQELKQGQRPNVKMRMKDTVATVATSPTQVESQIVRDNLYTPPEFYITTRIYIEEREIQQSIGDVTEEKYLEALEATMVAEDRLFRSLAVALQGQPNNLTQFVGTLTAQGLMILRNQVTSFNIPVASWLVANDLWSDIVGDTSFQAVIDPVSKNELLLTGQLGRIFGMTIYSDAYRHPQHKVLSQGEMFVIGDQINLGQYTDRGGVTSLPIDSSIEKVPGRGWMISELMSLVLANGRAVARGLRA